MVFMDLRGGRRKIEAQAYPVNYASLRCRLFMPKAMWPTVMKCAENLATIGGRRGRWMSLTGLSRSDARRLFAWRRVVQPRRGSRGSVSEVCHREVGSGEDSGSHEEGPNLARHI